MEAFLLARADSVLGQLDKEIPSTKEGQMEEEGKLVEALSISLEDMGVQGGGEGPGQERGRPPMERDFALEGGKREFPQGMERGNMPPGMPRQEEEGRGKSLMLIGTSMAAIVWGMVFVCFLPKRKMTVYKRRKTRIDEECT